MIYTATAYEDTRGSIRKKKNEPDDVFGKVCGSQYVKKYDVSSEEEAVREHAYYLYNFLMRSIKDSEDKVILKNSEKNESVIIVRSDSFFQVIRITAFRNLRQSSGIYKNFTEAEIDDVITLQSLIAKENALKMKNAAIYNLYMLCIYPTDNLEHAYKRMINVTVSAESRTAANIKFVNKITKQLHDLNVICRNIKDISVVYYGHDQLGNTISFDKYIQGKSPFAESFRIDYTFISSDGTESDNCISGAAIEYST